MRKSKGTAKVARAIRSKELDSIATDAEIVNEVDFDVKKLARLVAAVPRLLGEIGRLKRAVEERDDRLARIAGATKRPTKKRGPRKVQEAAGSDRVEDSKDPAQTSALEVNRESFMAP